MEIKFLGEKPHLQTFKSQPDTFRVLIDTGLNEYEKIKDIPTLPEGLYLIKISPVVEEVENYAQ